MSVSFPNKLSFALVRFDQDVTKLGTEVAALAFVEEVRAVLEARGPDVNTRNPIARLQERAQANGQTLPAYSWTKSGPSHIPTIECTCVAEGFSRTARSSSKQKSKRLAAARVMAAIEAAAAGIVIEPVQTC